MEAAFWATPIESTAELAGKARKRNRKKKQIEVKLLDITLAL
jgi:hypothetical protein